MHSPITHTFIRVGVLGGLDCGVEAWGLKGPIPPIVAVIPKRYNRSVLLHIMNLKFDTDASRRFVHSGLVSVPYEMRYAMAKHNSFTPK